VQQRLPWFLAAKPSTECAKGGAGAYTDAIKASAQDISGIAGLKDGLVHASSFRTSYTPLSAQADFINAMEVCN
jgi:Niemann-Pick C1 protein